MAFRDLSEFFDPDLRLPWRGKTYVIPAVSAEVGLRCEALMALGVKAYNAAETGQEVGLSDHDRQVLDDATEAALYRDVLGPVFAELEADGASWPEIKRMAMTALAYFTIGEEAAVAAWEGPKAPNREARRAAARTGTGGGNGTKPRASTNGTSSRKAKVQVSGSRSPGVPSSPAGA
jgi:hypothetical protein